MDKQLATTIFESPASGVRLDVFRLRVKNAPNGLVAGEIASRLALPPTNLSFQLKALTQSGLSFTVSDTPSLLFLTSKMLQPTHRRDAIYRVSNRSLFLDFGSNRIADAINRVSTGRIFWNECWHIECFISG